MAYATEAEYVDYSGRGDASGNADSDDVPRWLNRASDLIDEVLIGAVYPVDASGNPTGATVIAAFRDACCAQVEWWDTTGTGPEADIGHDQEYSSVGLGSLSLSRHNSATSSRGPSRLAARAWGHLRTAGLTPFAIATGYPDPGEGGFDVV
jgi:hypothetical protein